MDQEIIAVFWVINNGIRNKSNYWNEDEMWRGCMNSGLEGREKDEIR